MAFAQIYVCNKHGETIHPIRHTEIDIENDEVYEFLVCGKCFRQVDPLINDSKPVLRPLTKDELFWASFEGDF